LYYSWEMGLKFWSRQHVGLERNMEKAGKSNSTKANDKTWRWILDGC
jgi:hypothetical protein